MTETQVAPRACIRKGDHTPWGACDFVEVLADGICWVNTPGHGGAVLSAERLQQMPKALLAPHNGHGKESRFFEEDSEWSRVAIAFPEVFPHSQEQAKETLRNWIPDAYEAFYGETIPPGESHIKDQRAFYREHAESWVVVAAFGDWHAKVPKGSVGVVAVKGGHYRNSPSSRRRWFLVPDEEYGARSQFSFVIDPDRHQEVEPLQ